MGFLDNYEGNKERTDRWIATFPQGIIHAVIEQFDADKGYVLVKAMGYRNQEETIPADIDYAYGFLAAYNPNMKRWFVEDTVTSAKLRVMANLLGGTEKATKETMQQVESMSAKVATADPAKEYDYWTTKFGEVPSYKTEEDMEAAGVPTCEPSPGVNEPADAPPPVPDSSSRSMFKLLNFSWLYLSKYGFKSCFQIAVCEKAISSACPCFPCVALSKSWIVILPVSIAFLNVLNSLDGL